MLFVNFRKAFLSAMFILGAAALLIAYAGIPGPGAIKAPAEKTAASPVQAETLSPKGPPGTGQGPAMNTAGPARQGSEDFFVDYRLDREKSRGRQVEILEAIVNNPSSAVETRKTAQEKLLEISGSISKEARVENLLKAKGYDEAVVCLDQRGVTVVMESQGLTPAEEAGLIEMVSRETGFGEQGIIIVPRKR